MQGFNQKNVNNTVPGQSNKDAKRSKATLDNYFNDDYEPVRPQMKHDVNVNIENSGSDDEEQEEVMSYPSGNNSNYKKMGT